MVVRYGGNRRTSIRTYVYLYRKVMQPLSILAYQPVFHSFISKKKCVKSAYSLGRKGLSRVPPSAPPSQHLSGLTGPGCHQLDQVGGEVFCCSIAPPCSPFGCSISRHSGKAGEYIGSDTYQLSSKASPGTRINEVRGHRLGKAQEMSLPKM